MARAHLIVTDSGGIQEEAPFLKKPVLVMRDVTERPEAVALGVARLVGAETAAIVGAVRELLIDDAAYAKMAAAARLMATATPRCASAPPSASASARRAQAAGAARMTKSGSALLFFPGQGGITISLIVVIFMEDRLFPCSPRPSRRRRRGLSVLRDAVAGDQCARSSPRAGGCCCAGRVSRRCRSAMRWPAPTPLASSARRRPERSAPMPYAAGPVTGAASRCARSSCRW